MTRGEGECISLHTRVCVHSVVYRCRRGKDYNRPVGFVSAGVQGGSKGEGTEEGGSDSDEEEVITLILACVSCTL